MGTALLIIDVQNDFSRSKGALYVPGGEEVIAPINDLIDDYRSKGFPIVATRDWHERASRVHFKADDENTEGVGVWPPHCVQDTWGGQFDDDLDIAGVVIVTKGTDPEADSYSGFDGTVEDGRSLEQWLLDSDVQIVVVAGLATDYCVKETVLGARERGFGVRVVGKAIRPVNLQPDDGEKATTAMEDSGAIIEKK